VKSRKLMLNKILAFLSLCLILIGLFPVTALAQGYIPSKDNICGGPCPLIDTTFTASKETIATFIISIARFITYIAAALAVLFIVIGALTIITDSGDGKRAKSGWSNIRSSIVGLIVVIVAYTIVALLGNLIQGDLLNGLITPN